MKKIKDSDHDDNTTLQQGLEIFQKKNMKYFSERPDSKKGKEFLRNHDEAHIVFGCDTSRRRRVFKKFAV